MLLNIAELSAEPKHSQISRQVIDKILGGELTGGSHILSPRALACKNRVSLGTVKKAYSDLVQEGLITPKDEHEFVVADVSENLKLNVEKQFCKEKPSVERFSSNLDNLLESELDTACQIQFDLLPRDLPDDDQLTIAASIKSCRSIGGDFYDYLPIDENKFALVIGDACGKGLPGAMLVSQIQAVLKSEFRKGTNLKSIFQSINDQLVQYTPKDKFVTLFCGVFDKRTGILEYINAGHNFPFLVRKDSSCEFMRIGGPALGIIQGVLYQTGSISLYQNDTFCLYTDGVTEAMNASNDEYGEDRMLSLIIENRNKEAQDVVRFVLEDLSRFRSGKQQQDDQTIVLMKIRNLSKENPKSEYLNSKQILNIKK